MAVDTTIPVNNSTIINTLYEYYFKQKKKEILFKLDSQLAVRRKILVEGDEASKLMALGNNFPY